jgi:hypothetical protein
MNANTLYQHLLNGATLRAKCVWRRNRRDWDYCLSFPNGDTQIIQESAVFALVRKKLLRMKFEMSGFYRDYETVPV